jgi:hypothetical protein
MTNTDGTSALAIDPGRASLFSKMAKVMSLVNRVPKNGMNAFHKYKYATTDDVADIIREAMAEANLALFVEMGEPKQEAIEDDSSGKTKRMIRTTIQFFFTFACGDSGATRTSPWTGQVDDNSDKAINKCATSAEKYFLMKTFIVSAGDEPDADADKHREEVGRRAAPPPIPPKYARECLEDPDCRRQFAAFRAKLNIADDKPYLAALGKQWEREPLERYSDYPGKFSELMSNMEAIHEALNTLIPTDAEMVELELIPAPAASITAAEAAEKLGNGGNRRIPDTPKPIHPPETPITIEEARKLVASVGNSEEPPPPDYNDDYLPHVSQVPNAGGIVTTRAVEYNGKQVYVRIPNTNNVIPCGDKAAFIGWLDKSEVGFAAMNEVATWKGDTTNPKKEFTLSSDINVRWELTNNAYVLVSIDVVSEPVPMGGQVL